MKFFIENAPPEIFTDYDDTIFSDGSIDPLGLLIIWTSLGNRIFHNRLNSISTNIRSYTLNLFHNSVIGDACKAQEEKFVNLLGRSPYLNKNEVYDGLAIFLECLLVHALVQQEFPLKVSEKMDVPGKNKLNNIFITNPNKEICKSIPVNRGDGILVRQHFLGVHGRHKGPFQQMDLFDKQDYYANEILWDDVNKLFEKGPLSGLKKALMHIIEQNVLSAKVKGEKAIRVKVSAILTPELIDLYENAFTEQEITNPAFSEFWKEKLGLGDNNSPAGKIYEDISKSKREEDPQEILYRLANKSQDPMFGAIKTIEPFIAMIQKIMEKLLTRGHPGMTKELKDFIHHQFKNAAIDVDSLYDHIREEFLSSEARVRLKRLLEIYVSCKSPVDPERFIDQLVEFHHVIMKQRGNIPWVSFGNGRITQHRTFAYSDRAIEQQDSYDWVNSYYIPTVIQLHQGMS